MSTATTRTTRAPRRTQAERREGTRAALLEAAVRCVGRVGFAGTTTTDVATEAGLSRGAVQHHFGDKNELMTAVVELGWKDLVVRLRGIAAVDGTLAERVDAVVDRMWESYSSEAFQAGLEVTRSVRGNPALRDAHAELLRESRSTLDEEWRRVFSDAPVSAERIRMSRRLARSLLSGILQQRSFQSTPADVAADVDLLKETVYRTLTSESDWPTNEEKA